MKELGLGLLLVGLISLALRVLAPGVQYVFLTWIDQWGTNVGWAIRIGMTLLGLLLWLGFKNRE